MRDDKAKQEKAKPPPGRPNHEISKRFGQDNLKSKKSATLWQKFVTRKQSSKEYFELMRQETKIVKPEKLATKESESEGEEDEFIVKRKLVPGLDKNKEYHRKDDNYTNIEMQSRRPDGGKILPKRVVDPV